MASPADVLDSLRPLRPPPPDGTSEILLMALAGAAGAAALMLAWRFLRERRRPLRRAALAALASSRSLPAPDRLAAQAQILRDVASALDHGARALRGDAWLARLDAIFATRFFTQGPGRIFGEALYRRRADEPAEALDRDLARLFQGLAR
jgi:hypothetical protein